MAWSRPTVAVCRSFLLASVLVLAGEFRVDLSAVSDRIYLHIGLAIASSTCQDTLLSLRHSNRSGQFRNGLKTLVCGERFDYLCCNAPCNCDFFYDYYYYYYYIM